MSEVGRSAETRRRLLEAAAHVFSDQGFRGATIQAICRRAGANIAAVHYHFGDKQELYAAVFEWANAQVDPAPEPDDTDGAPEERLRAHVRWFVRRLLDRNRPAWMARLMAREMMEPTPMLDRLVRQRMQATHARLGAVVRALLGRDADDDTVRLCTLSVVAQCVFWRNSAAVVSRLYPDLARAGDVERVAEHVTRFSLAAMLGLRNGTRKGGKP